jgi:hypothetical protein
MTKYEIVLALMAIVRQLNELIERILEEESSSDGEA